MSPRPPPPLLLLLSQPPDGSRGLSTAAVSRKKCCNFHRFSFCPSGHCHPTTRRSFNFLSGRGSLGRSGRSLVGNNVLPVLLARDEHGRTGDKDVEFQKLQSIIVQRSTSHYFSVQCHEISYGENSILQKGGVSKIWPMLGPYPVYLLNSGQGPLERLRSKKSVKGKRQLIDSASR